MDDDKTTLCEVKLGDTCIVKGFKKINKNTRRLCELGFVSGTRVVPLLESMSGETKAYLVKGSIISIRPHDSDNILVTLI